MSSETIQLLVVGAGPAGLSAALAARALGVDVTVLEAESADRVRPGSRALYVHRETLDRLDRMSPGLGGKIAAFGIRWRTARTLYHGREVYARHYPGQPGAPPYASLRQVDTERFLTDACREAGVVFSWESRVETVRTTPEEATATCAGGRTWRSEYLIGADGARSATRESLGIAMDGARSTDYRVAVDIAMEQPVPERIMHYRHPAMSGQNVLTVPFTGGIQVDVQCASPSLSEELADPGSVREWLPRVAGPGCLDRILWTARYPCLQRIAESFVDPHRRVLLAGEAAHLFVPLGARGMNSGIADSDAAAAAVSIALRSRADERRRAAIDDYELVRRQAAERNRQWVNSALRHLRAGTRSAIARQAAAARLARFVPQCGSWLDKAPYGPRGAVTVSIGRY